jgi:hypothetical protein
MSLFSELGFGYANDMFNGASFLYKGKPHVLQGVTDSGRALAVRYANCEIEEHDVIIDAEYFDTWDKFSYPTLGYRQDEAGNFLGYYFRRPSTRRGLHMQDVLVVPHFACEAIESNLGYLGEPGITSRHHSVLVERKMEAVMMPKYTPFAVGLPKVLAGEIPFFCSSAEFAIAPSPRSEELDILYRRRKIGYITPSGAVTMSISNPTVNSLWEEETTRG